MVTALITYYFHWQAKLTQPPFQLKKQKATDRGRNNNNIGWLRGIISPSKQQQPAPQKQQHLLEETQQLPHPPPHCQPHSSRDVYGKHKQRNQNGTEI